MKEQEQIGWGWAAPGYLNTMYQYYRLGSDDFNRLWERQRGRCAGCKAEFAHPFIKAMKTGLRCEVDHKHVDEAKLQVKQKCEAEDVRGLLCRRCNDFLGKVKDRADTLQNLADYLKAHKEKK